MFSAINKFIKRRFEVTMASVMLLSQLLFPLVSIQSVYAASPISLSTHQGQLSPSGTYTSGNITTYSEGDTIDFRFTATSAGASSGSIDIDFTGNDTGGQPCLFFDQSFSLGSIDNVSGTSPGVATNGTPVADGDDWAQTLDFTFAAAGSAVVNYTLTLSGDAGACAGSSQHSQFGDNTGDVGEPGKQTVPIPAKDILVLPDVIVTKKVDVDGDGVVDRTANANEWSFTLDSTTTLQTDSNGQVKFADVAGGAHTLSELGPNGYFFLRGSGDCEFTRGEAAFSVTVTADTEDIECTFENGTEPQSDDEADITVRKFADYNGNGRRDEGERLIKNWGMRLYNSSWTLVEQARTPDGGNKLEFDDLVLGTYYLCEVVQESWNQSLPVSPNGAANQSPATDEYDRCYQIVLNEDDQVEDRLFGNFKVSQIVITKHNDPGFNGPAGENPVLSGWDFRFYDSQWSELWEGTTNNDGKVRLGNLPLGSYYVCEVAQDNWVQTFPRGNTNGAVGNESNANDETNICYQVLVREPGSIDRHFFNAQLGNIGIKKFNDRNANREKSGNEPWLAGWTIKVFNSDGDEVETVQTVSNGFAEVSGLKPGTYYVCEELRHGWMQTTPLSDARTPVEGREDGRGCVRVIIEKSGQVTPVVFGNYKMTVLEGTKYRDNNEDGNPDTQEMTLNGWRIRLYRGQNWSFVDSNITGSDASNYGDVDRGEYRFAVKPGVYFLCEVMQNDWAQTGPQVGDLVGPATAVQNNSGHNDEGEACWRIRVESGGQTYYAMDFGNIDFGTVTVYKKVVNDDGGRLKPHDFKLKIDGNYRRWGEPIKLPVGYHRIDEADPRYQGYEKTKVHCYDADTHKPVGKWGHIKKLEAGQDVHCVIVNDDIPPVVIVEKQTYPRHSSQDFGFGVHNNHKPVDRFRLDTSKYDHDGIYKYHKVEGLRAGMVRIQERPVEGWANGYKVVCTPIRHIGMNNPEVLLGEEEEVATTDSRNRQRPKPIVYEHNTTQVRFPVQIGQVIKCVFTNIELADVEVTKFWDADEDGYFDEGEQTLEGWEMNLDVYKFKNKEDNNQNTAVPAGGSHETLSQLTEEDGSTTFEDLLPFPHAFYKLSETQQEGWNLTGLYCDYKMHDDRELVSPDEAGVNMPDFGDWDWEDQIPVFTYPGAEVQCYVGNFPDPQLLISKYVDDDFSETGDTVQYTIVVEVPETSGRVYDSSGNNQMMPFPVPVGVSNLIGSDIYVCAEYECGCEYPMPYPMSDYEEHDYKCEEEEVVDVTVVDLAPEGFEVVAGSQSATSNMRGDVTDYTGYASPGIWSLTDGITKFLEPGEIVTMVYNAVVSNQPSDGTHPDTAFASGFDSGSDVVLANAHLSTPFVGTQVTIVTDDLESQGVVLANTGTPAQANLIVGAIIAFAAMTPLIFTSKKGRKISQLFTKMGAASGRLISLLVVASAFVMISSASVMAAGTWQVKMFTPQVDNDSGTLNLNYQVLSLSETDTFTVKALQNGVVIGTQNVSTPYGDTGGFTVDLPTEGDYTFAVMATNNGVAESETTTAQGVSFDESAPAAPSFGTKTQVGNEFTITFTVPAGTDATEVNIFASTSSSFIADADTLVGTVAATPGVEQSFTYTAPNSDIRFFAVQTVDPAGNQSPVASESIATVTDPDAGVGAVEGDLNGDGVVDEADAALAAAAAAEGTVDANGAATDTAGDSDVLGDEDSSNNTALIIIIIGVLAAAGLYYLRQQNDSDIEDI